MVCLLRRIGVSVTLEKLSPNLKTFLYQKRSDLLTEMGDTIYRDLPNKVKLDILNFVCLCQFDDNQVFKSDITSNFAPDDLRLVPLGWDFESSQYWYLSVSLFFLSLNFIWGKDEQIKCRTPVAINFHPFRFGTMISFSICKAFANDTWYLC